MSTLRYEMMLSKIWYVRYLTQSLLKANWAIKSMERYDMATSVTFKRTLMVDFLCCHIPAFFLMY